MRLMKAAMILALLVAIAMPAFAQETTGSVRGRVADPQGLAVPGATVTVTGPQGVKTTTTDSDGRFAIPFLTPGTYSARAELQGFKTAEQQGLTVSLGQTVDVAFKMEIGGVTETVQVTSAARIVDTTSTTAGAVISSDLLQNIPVGRRISDALYLAPGVSSGGTVGQANPSVSGGTGLENHYVIDGVNVTNMGYGALGSYSTIFGSLGNATPIDFVKEIQVKTAGYEAEFGQSTGGVINVVTKSGSNDLRGSAFGYSRPSDVEGAWTQYQSPNGTVQTVSSRNYEGGVEGGAPIMKNHVFFFGAIDPSRDIRTIQAPAGFPLLSLGGVDRIRDSVTYSAKATIQLSSNHRFDASFFGDPSTGPNGPQRVSALTATTTSQYSAITYGGHNQTVRYSGVLSSSWLLEGYYARALNNITETPSVNAWQVSNQTVTPNIQSGGIGFYEQGNHSLNNQFSLKSTNIMGGHSIRYGFEYDDITWNQLNQYTGPTLTINGQQTATGAQVRVITDPTYGNIYRVVRARFVGGAFTTQHYGSAFVQDTWKVGSRLTVNPGLRYEQETMNGDAITGFSLKNNWAPRIGATFALTDDGKTKLFGNFGRYYAQIPNDLAARALSGEVTITQADFFDAGLTKQIPDGTKQSGGAAGDTIDPNAKLSYTNEFVVGIEREIMPNTSFGVRYIYRNIGRVLEDVANCPMVAYEPTSPAAWQAACSSVQYILTNPSSATPINPALLAVAPVFNSVSFADPVHKYDAVEFTLNRRMSNNWSALASYRWSRLRGNFEGFYRDDNGQSDPGISSLYDFPTNDPTYTSIGGPLGYPGDIRYLSDPNGILPLDRPNQIKIFGNYMLPMGLNLGVGVNMSSGKPLTPLAPNPNYGNGGEIPTAPRGAGFTTVDGVMTRTPFQSQVDFQASYAIKFGSMRNLTLMADVFNLFNQQIVQDYNNFTSLTYGAGPNPNFGTPTSQIIAGPQYQTPRQVRLGVRFTF